MDVAGMAADISAASQARIQDQVSLAVLKQALEIQQQSALQMLEALPAVPSASGGMSTSGGYVDVYA